VFCCIDDQRCVDFKAILQAVLDQFTGHQDGIGKSSDDSDLVCCSSVFDTQNTMLKSAGVGASASQGASIDSDDESHSMKQDEEEIDDDDHDDESQYSTEDPLSLLEGVDTPKMLFDFTSVRDPSCLQCAMMSSYFDVLMMNIDEFTPEPEDFELAKYDAYFNGGNWWESQHLPCWEKISKADFQPFWNLLLAGKPPAVDVLHRIERDIMYHPK
jgi:hypothetical protein